MSINDKLFEAAEIVSVTQIDANTVLDAAATARAAVRQQTKDDLQQLKDLEIDVMYGVRNRYGQWTRHTENKFFGSNTQVALGHMKIGCGSSVEAVVVACALKEWLKHSHEGWRVTHHRQREVVVATAYDMPRVRYLFSKGGYASPETPDGQGGHPGERQGQHGPGALRPGQGDGKQRHAGC